jgi:hypothetical protein
MSKKSPQRQAWRQRMIEAKALEQSQSAPPEKVKAPLSERQRLLFGSAVALVFAYFCLKMLERIVNSLGIRTWIHHDSPVTRSMYIGRSWYESSFSDEFTETYVVLAVLSIVIGFWVGRAVFYANIRAGFNRRSAWYVSGWIIGVAIVIAESQLAVWFCRQNPWLTHISWLLPWLILFGMACSMRLFAYLWTALMRRCGVTGEGDAFSEGTV